MIDNVAFSLDEVTRETANLWSGEAAKKAGADLVVLTAAT